MRGGTPTNKKRDTSSYQEKKTQTTSKSTNKKRDNRLKQ